MLTTIICNFIGPDKTGLVEHLAKAISESHGNWLESSMAQLAGQFAGIVRVSIDSLHVDALQKRLHLLEQHGLTVRAETVDDKPLISTVTLDTSIPLQLSIVGNDRPGIVYEVTQALTAAGISVVNMQTHLSSAPMSGDSLFHSSMTLENQQNHNLDKLELQLDTIAERLSIEIDMETMTENS